MVAEPLPPNTLSGLLSVWVLCSALVDWRCRVRGGVPPTHTERKGFRVVYCVWISLMILGGFLAGNPGGFEGDMTALYLNFVLGIWEFRRWRIRRRNPIPKPAG